MHCNFLRDTNSLASLLSFNEDGENERLEIESIVC